MSTGSYQDLDVWQKSARLAEITYRLTKQFPLDERYGLTAQLRRASISVSANIAEGWGRGSRAELRNRLAIARGSLNETESHFAIAERCGFATSDELADVRALVTDIRRMLIRLRQSL